MTNVIGKLVLGERMKLPKHSSFRSMSPIFREKDGVLIAFLGMEHGWGKCWEFYPIQQGNGSLSYDGFEPAQSSGVGYYHNGKACTREEAVKGFFEGERFASVADKFKDANERVAIDKDLKASANKFIDDSVNNMKDLLHTAKRRRDAMRGITERLGLDNLTPEETDAIREAIIAFESEMKTLEGSIKFAESKRDEV